ncbi:MAG: tetratricopeptide repeat protein [Chloroflexi bacterium]|nr:tetratricopeptide repeat protein [Chloroflexota bacterium]
MNAATPPRAAQTPARRSAFNPVSVVALLIAVVLLILAALEGRKLQPDFQYPTTTATVTDYTVNVYANLIMATLAGPIEVVATANFSVDGTSYTFTGQFRRLVNPGDVNPTTRTLIGSRHQVWYDPTNPKTAAFYPLGAVQIGMYAGAGWIALMIGLAPIVLTIKGARSARSTAAIRSEEGVSSDTDYQKAVALYDQKQYRPALAQFDRVLKKGGSTVEVHRYRARAFYALGEVDNAIKAISAALVVEPHDQTLYLQRTKLYLKQDNREAAIRDLTRAIELRKDDDDFDLYMQRGRIYEDWNRLEDAINDYNMALKLHPDTHELHLKKAQILEKRQLFREALEEYEAYLYSGLADERGEAEQIEAKIKQMYAKGWR